MKRIIYLAFLLLTFTGSLEYGFGQTDIPGGEVSGTWSLSGSPYRIHDSILIPADSLLVIEPGVKLEFQGHFILNVQGKLQAIGTPSDSITFTVSDTTGFSDPLSIAGGWNGIRFIDTPLDNDSSKIEYCLIEFSKAIGSSWPDNSGGAILIVNYDNIKISHCLIRNNLAGGSEAPSGGAIHIAGSDIRLEYNHIIHNQAEWGGGIQMYESNPILQQNVIADNKAINGGGILILNASNPTFDGDSLINNRALENGGGLMSWSGSYLQFEEVVVSGNQASWGSGLGLSGLEASFYQSYIQNNISGGLGGGIGADYCRLMIDNTTITMNSAVMSGGIHAWYTTLEITESDISHNTADFGGGIHADFSQLELIRCDISENQASNGGGLHIWNSDLVIDSCEFTLNHVISEGGAIEYNLADTLVFGVPHRLRITGSLFQQNTADFRAAGIRIEQFDSDSSMADVFIDRCVFTENHAERISGLRIVGNLEDFEVSNSVFHDNFTDLWNGGASFSGNSKGLVINCEFSDNVAASGNPGGVGVSTGSFVHFINCTFVNNVSNTTGGLSVHRNGKASVTNCIFWGNNAQQLSARGINENNFSELYVNYCNIQYGKDSIEVDSLAALYWGEGNINEDPLYIDPDNGDFHLLDDSPCIDAGTDSVEILGTWYRSPLKDLEGNTRTLSGEFLPDMGAYENQTIIGLAEKIKNEDFLMDIYPNPFTQRLVIEITLKSARWVSICVFNHQGKEVIDLINQMFPAGTYQISWDAKGLEGGMYYCKVKTLNSEYSRKLVLRR